ncbi:CDGSH iron-sulfur domain-containing protein [Corynebacterium sp. NPDC060344]|uniref:CDGSH iron-sulfur domain-containing protein n=1 Tax=Corynebacterium sp. NPDC060344 TaxID=3347101 RepID=UPI003647CBFE
MSGSSGDVPADVEMPEHETAGDVPTDAARAGDAGAVITACPNGPLLVRGDFAIAAEPGADPERAERAVVALCRCGASSIKPLCDGTHKLIGFTTEKSGDTSGGASERTSPDRRS